MDFINNTDHYDQHFLINEEVKKRFVLECGLSSFMEIVEVGPGKGDLTSLMASEVKKITCIELDERLKNTLEPLKNKFNNLEIIYGNVLDVYIPKCDKIVSALPYSIIEPFIYKLIKCSFNEAVLIVGNKFANNVVEKESSKLSILTNCFFETKKIIEIQKNAFLPPPRVTSSIIKLTPIKSENLLNNLNMFIFRELFFYNEKKIKNVLIEAFIRYEKLKNCNFTKNESRQIISGLNISDDILNKTIDSCNNKDIIILEKAFNRIEI